MLTAAQIARIKGLHRCNVSVPKISRKTGCSMSECVAALGLRPSKDFDRQARKSDVTGIDPLAGQPRPDGVSLR